MRDARRGHALGFWQAMVELTTLGWLIALPIAAGVLLGRYLDVRLGSGVAWTLALLGAGVAVAGLDVYLALRRVLIRSRRD
ncbi:MAG TPA: AtpZ/AtpI family protein [bacterium]|nr:AtpZ/AtpI family protein [bacterium]